MEGSKQMHNDSAGLPVMVEEARLALRQAAGELTTAEQAAADRRKVTEEFELKLDRTLGTVTCILTLGMKVVFIDDFPVAEFDCEGKIFHFRPVSTVWHLSQVVNCVETEVTTIQNNDPLIKARVLASIGDHL